MGLMKNIASSGDWKGFTMTLSPASVADIQKKLDAIGNDFKDKALMKALRSGGKIFIIEAKRRQTVSDRVDQAIGGQSKKVGGVRGYLAGVKSVFPNPAWIEYGTLDKYVGFSKRHKPSYRVKRTKTFRSRTSGAYVTLRGGHVISSGIRPRPFLNPTWDTKKEAMFNEIGNVLSKELKKHGK